MFFFFRNSSCLTTLSINITKDLCPYTSQVIKNIFCPVFPESSHINSTCMRHSVKQPGLTPSLSHFQPDALGVKNGTPTTIIFPLAITIQCGSCALHLIPFSAPMPRAKMSSHLRFMCHVQDDGAYKSAENGIGSLLGFPGLNFYLLDGKMSLNM